MQQHIQTITESLTRIAEALERITNQIAPKPNLDFDHNAATAFIWNAETNTLNPIQKVNHIPIKLLCGIDQQKQALLDNTRYFAQTLPANNALLWGARGQGKSSLVKAVHATVNKQYPLKLIEINREDITSLPNLLNIIKNCPIPCIVFCDDLSFDNNDTSYKSLKTILEGGVEGKPNNVIFYATSNRRHMLAREMIENEQDTAINPYETTDEKLSLSDRFGLWIGFHHCSQDTYLNMVETYVKYYKLNVTKQQWQPQALAWAVTRGSRCGRVAWQFTQQLMAQNPPNPPDHP